MNNHTAIIHSFESQLIERIYDAALNPSLWPEILEVIRKQCAADQCSIFFYDATSRRRNFAASTKQVDTAIKKYLDDFIDLEAADFHEGLAGLEEGKVANHDEIVKVAGTPYDRALGDQYMQLILPNLTYQAGIILLRGRLNCAGFGVRNLPDTPAISESSLAFLRRISCHLVKSIRLYHQAKTLSATSRSIEQLLAQSNVGIFLLNKNNKMLFSNKEAVRILETSDIFVIEQGVLRLRHGELNLNHSPNEQTFFLQNIPHRSFAVTGKDVSTPFKLTLIAATDQHFLHEQDEDIAAILLVRDASSPIYLPREFLMQAFGLTEAEIDVAHLLMQAQDINNIAKERQTSVETARGHIKNILHKTNTHSKTELVRVLACLSGN